ncbi:MAG TPA: hypothetical protein VG672_27985 [Bryobacteraceae bacterium]|nr:hypothetical protein [Bryobacteraceae bacterium]
MPISSPASAAPFAPAPAKPFAPNHPWERNFYLAIIALAWVGILRGFGGDVANHLASHEAPYPIIVHVHAVVFVAWLALFTVQILLIRTKRLAVHKKLGYGLAWMAGLMVVLGPVTALTVHHLKLVNHLMTPAPVDQPQFLSIQFTDMLAFASLTATGLFFRKTPSAHKRLILLGTLYITDAGFARWLAPGFMHALGHTYWPFWFSLYFGPNLLVVLTGAYDLATRRRLHPAYLAGVIWVFAIQMLSVSLFFSPGWAATTQRIATTWPW